MGKQEFEARHGFVPVLDTRRTPAKRRSIAPYLAKDHKYMEKMGFVLIEAPKAPPTQTPEGAIMLPSFRAGIDDEHYKKSAKEAIEKAVEPEPDTLVEVKAEKPKRATKPKQVKAAPVAVSTKQFRTPAHPALTKKP